MGTTTALEFLTWGGHHGITLREGAHEGSPIVLVAPALGIRASYYARLVQGLAARGLGAVAVDPIGHGDHPKRAASGQDWGYGELLEHYRAACACVRAHRPRAPLVIVGHSLGGQLALMLAGEGVEGLRKVVLVASGTPYWRCWPRRQGLGILAGSTLVRAIASTLGYFPGHRLGFGGLEARTLMVQWSAFARHGRYAHGDFAGEELLHREGVGVHAICIEGDDWAPRAAMEHVLDKVSAYREVEMEIWRDPPQGGDHNRWPSVPGFVIDRLVTLLRDVPEREV